MSAVGTDALIEEALLTRLAALTFSPAIQVAWPNKQFPASGSVKPETYLQASLLRAETRGIGISAWNEHAGILQVDVLYKAQDGEIKPANIAGQVAEWFERGTRLPNGAVTVKIDDPPAIASAMPNGDGYLKIPVSVRYRAFVR